jgi:chemotaxis signal transduction protein
LDQYKFNDSVEDSADILAIRVGNIHGMEYFHKDQLDTDLHHMEEARRHYVWGILKKQEHLITVFDPAAILQFCQNTLFTSENTL